MLYREFTSLIQSLLWFTCISGQTSLPPSSGGLGTTSLFGGPTATSQSQQGSSLFGGPQTQPTNTQQTGGVFGSLGNQSTGGGLFSSQQNQQTTSSIFGGNNARQSQPQQAEGIFGSTLGQTQGQNQGIQGTGLFGSTPDNHNRSSLFGTTQPATLTQQPMTQPCAPVNIFSSTIGQQVQQQHMVPGVRVSVNELRPTTRFNDLHEELQKAIEYVDAFIVNKVKWQEECEAANSTLEDFCQQMPSDVEHCTKKLDVVQQALENDAESISFAKGLVKADAADAKLNFKIVNNLKLPQQFHHANIWSNISAPQTFGIAFPDTDLEEGVSRNLVDFFSKQADEMSKVLRSYKRNVAEVEAFLEDVEQNVLQQTQQFTFSRSRDEEKAAEDQVRELAGVLREFENGILGVATKVGIARESVQNALLGPLGDKNDSLVGSSRFNLL